MIQHITLDDLRGMTDREVLILQGCGGEPQEWLDGINEMFTENGILRGGDQFRNVSVFEHDGHTNLLFHMDEVDLDIGKLAMWRLQSHSTSGGCWLSDYLSNKLGVRESDAPLAVEPQMPEAPIIGQDGNIFNVIGIAARALRENGLADQAKEMSERAFASGSYDQALGVIMEYVTPVSVDDGMDEDDGWRQEPEYDEEEWEDPDMEQGFGGMRGMS
jgi:hypothetical protein